MIYNTRLGNSTNSLDNTRFSSLFKGSNSLGAKDIFNAKKKYDHDAFLLTADGVPNEPNDPIFTSGVYSLEPYTPDGVFSIFNKTRLPLYGTVNDLVIPLQPKKENISYYLENEAGFSALDFVMNSFINLRKAYSRNIYENQVVFNGKALSDLKVVKARDDGQRAIQDFFDQISRDFMQDLANNPVERKRIITPENFVGYLSNKLIYYSNINLITYSSFLMSDKIDINFNGLCIDIAPIQYDADSSKVSQIILDPNFSLYLDTAKSFGFVVSREYPFKLVADLGSPKLRESICNCGTNYRNGIQVDKVEDIIDFYYEPAYLYDFEYMRNLYEVIYTHFFSTYKVEFSDTYYNGYIHRKRINRFASQSQTISSLLTDKLLLSLYIKIKNNEMRLNFSEGSLKRFHSIANTIYDMHGLESALKYINEKLRVALEPSTPEKIGFENKEYFNLPDALALIRLTRYDY